MKEARVATARMTHDKDTRVFHRFAIRSEDGEAVRGSIYFLKSSWPEGTPGRVTIEVVQKEK